MKSPVLNDTRAEQAPPVDARPSRRVRQDHEIRQQLLRPQQTVPEGQEEPDAPSWGVPGGAVPRAADFLLEEGDEWRTHIIGSGDRAHHLALAPGATRRDAQRPANGRESLVLPLRPESRVECQRRCGKAGFCDPASDLGCGGEYCGNVATWREAL
ncbi:hypothetical protein [Pigmentiphaga sp.]|uniref:hypothetical protein n=1 Tax=Pigmentiphaga sp. TaxID=1977564 RepID=UPI0025CEA289|nr:hypothetical protein [Pigmentiphaga sp.]